MSPYAWPDIDPCFVKQSGTINLLEWTPELKPGPASGAHTQDPLLATSTGNVVFGLKGRTPSTSTGAGDPSKQMGGGAGKYAFPHLDGGGRNTDVPGTFFKIR